MLLRRYGIVIRDLLAREANLPSWRELLMAFRRLEDRERFGEDGLWMDSSANSSRCRWQWSRYVPCGVSR